MINWAAFLRGSLMAINQTYRMHNNIKDLSACGKYHELLKIHLAKYIDSNLKKRRKVFS